jgi:hypothetical protein
VPWRPMLHRTPPLLSSPSPAPTWHRAGPPLTLFLPARAAEPPQKGIAPRRPSFHLFSSHLRRCTTPPPPLPSPRHPCPPTVTERRRNALDSARTTPPPTFVGERRSELRSFTTNRPLLIALLLQAAGACHGYRRPPCQLHRRRTPPRSAAPPLHRRAGTGVSPASTLLAQHIRHLSVVL